MPLEHPKSKISFEQIPKVTPNGVPKTVRNLQNPDLDPQGVPGGAPVDHLMTEMVIQEPKQGTQKSFFPAGSHQSVQHMAGAAAPAGDQLTAAY